MLIFVTFKDPDKHIPYSSQCVSIFPLPCPQHHHHTHTHSSGSFLSYITFIWLFIRRGHRTLHGTWFALFRALSPKPQLRANILLGSVSSKSAEDKTVPPHKAAHVLKKNSFNLQFPKGKDKLPNMRSTQRYTIKSLCSFESKLLTIFQAT